MRVIIYYKNIKFKGIRLLCIYLIALFSLSACNKGFLDVVPDNIPTIEHAFANKQEAEKYLHTCYSYLPAVTAFSTLFFGSDDVWTYQFNNYAYQSPWKIALGEQNKVNPLVNYWDGENHAKKLFNALRDCNIFIENVSNVSNVIDLDPEMRKRWVAEAQFLKAYYHFFLLRMYGPIPIIDKNLPISSTPDEVKVKRDPFDKVVNYIVDLLDQSATNLPASIQNQTTEAGRIAKPAALMLKAKLLVMAASPLFNGNPDYASFADHDGVRLFNPTYEESKWKKAADACEKALEASSGISLFEFPSAFVRISDTTLTQMNIRGSVTEKWNSELIWGRSTQDTRVIQAQVMVDAIDYRLGNVGYMGSYMSATMKMAELFYSENGVPIEEDRTWNYNKRYELKKSEYKERFNVKEGYATANLNFKRENRFYASLGFDGGVFYLQNSISGTDENTWFIQARFGQPQGKKRDEYYNVTGYWIKKLVNWKFVHTEAGHTTEQYAWPEMRLADLYLLYAESLNEIGLGDEAIVWLDKIRKRAGLKGVKESWGSFSKQPTKFTTKDGLRQIIQQERSIELAFEGSRIWDLRRWKTAEILQNQPVKGWDIYSKSAEDYYRIKTIFDQEFVSPRDYLWPLKEYDLTVNPKLVQNPGW